MKHTVEIKTKQNNNRCVDMEMWRYEHVEMWRFGCVDVEMCRSGVVDVEMCRCEDE